MFFSIITLLVALIISGVSAYYSIVGLTAIFAAAFWPIVIMGSALEAGKIVSTLWLHYYWDQASIRLKLYLVPAVCVLMFLTSMGTFGFLSKSHADQTLVSGDVTSVIALFDEKIRTQREIIDGARKAQTQLDASVDQVMGRTTDESGALKSANMRRSQAKERGRLQSDIDTAQKTISKLQEERAPIAAQVRKVEADVGPVKYIAALIYGDNPSLNLLESAVRWVIIIIVSVFDPLAIVLMLAATTSLDWAQAEREVKRQRKAELKEKEPEEDCGNCPKCNTRLINASGIGPYCPNKDCDVLDGADLYKPDEGPAEIIVNEPDSEVTINHLSPENWHESFPEKQLIVEEQTIHLDAVTAPAAEPIIRQILAGIPAPETIVDPDPVNGFDVKKFDLPEVEIAMEVPNLPEETPQVDPLDLTASSDEITTSGAAAQRPYKDLSDGYVMYDGKHMNINALKELKPEFFMLTADSGHQISTNFGVQFPKVATKGDVFVRVDALPNRVYKFDSHNWIEINKDRSDSYLYHTEYIQYLINKIAKGEYDVELLSDHEKIQIEDFLRTQNN